MHGRTRMDGMRVPASGNTLDAGRQTSGHRGYVLAILAGLLVAELSKDIIFSTNRGKWFPACGILYYAVIAGLPFLLRRLAPKAAGF